MKAEDFSNILASVPVKYHQPRRGYVAFNHIQPRRGYIAFNHIQIVTKNSEKENTDNVGYMISQASHKF
jgi:hypothetical protein